MRKFALSVLLMLAIACIGAMASTVEVGTCLNGYTHFPTIQAAITAVPNNSTIMVCPGSYPEQITIAKPLTLKGVTLASASGASIVPPAGGVMPNTTSLTSGAATAAQVLVQNTKGVTLTNLTVDGSNNGMTGCAPNFFGIYFRNASGSLSQMAVLNQILTSDLLGCQTGLAIFVQSGAGGKSTLDVNNSVVQNYQKNGITGNEVGTKLTIEETTVTGIGFTNAIAQNGVQFGFGATGSISNSIVMDDVYYDPSVAASTGILIDGAPGVTASNNVVGNTQSGIASYSEGADGSGGNATIAGNEISATHDYDGIELCSNNNNVKSNVISTSDEAGIRVDGACAEPNSTPPGTGNKIKSNTINSACAGILVANDTTLASNQTSGNTFFNTPNTVLHADSCAAAPVATTLALTANTAKQPTRPQPVR